MKVSGRGTEDAGFVTVVVGSEEEKEGRDVRAVLRVMVVLRRSARMVTVERRR